jgi:hypothetical protein
LQVKAGTVSSGLQVVTIIGATYGIADVTAKVQALYASSQPTGNAYTFSGIATTFSGLGV